MPDEGRSIPPIILSKVDLPLPDLPMMLTNSPADISRLMFFSAENDPAGVWKVFDTSCREITGLSFSLKKSNCGV